ncbi:hypothetical protein Ptr902_12889 [Pyrenophora tritici-repentis]|uniref:Uncharacterized protein n=2 Tax=Pyrenophora tritici-repentis TaxID=45151 RepID=A0A2W1DAS1_9PLEO|nr:hypothetical protein A1F99_099940 [Pyrenophora tritici-repentis]KAI0579331.1 hypothetical protein Alg215_05830 [Pyrenophora tritici-repentis]KAI1512357.1 hypothetical protein Ptr86124_008323 [Pyrenophora tritici-repentis]KAI1540518.1 hypothetical protein PtrSN001A_004155 [Pyrenophora tritici-repentis]KAI1541356.1 hypothetical protein PtrSN001C_004538 [Pyrenophora tritici-repentis]
MNLGGFEVFLDETNDELKALQERHQDELDLLATDSQSKTHHLQQVHSREIHLLQSEHQRNSNDLADDYKMFMLDSDSRFSSEIYDLEVEHGTELAQQLAQQRLELTDAHEAQLHQEKLDVSRARADAAEFTRDLESTHVELEKTILLNNKHVGLLKEYGETMRLVREHFFP